MRSAMFTPWEARRARRLRWSVFPIRSRLRFLRRILAGGLSKMVEAECTVIGGHSVRDPELKFGYAVTGTIDPHRVLTNSGAQARRCLVLTKALGTGVISTAIKKGTADVAWIEAATRSMTTLNRSSRGDMLEVRRPWDHRRHRIRVDRPCPGDGAGQRHEPAAVRIGSAFVIRSYGVRRAWIRSRRTARTIASLLRAAWNATPASRKICKRSSTIHKRGRPFDFGEPVTGRRAG